MPRWVTWCVSLDKIRRREVSNGPRAPPYCCRAPSIVARKRYESSVKPFLSLHSSDTIKP